MTSISDARKRILLNYLNSDNKSLMIMFNSLLYIPITDIQQVHTEYVSLIDGLVYRLFYVNLMKKTNSFNQEQCELFNVFLDELNKTIYSSDLSNENKQYLIKHFNFVKGLYDLYKEHLIKDETYTYKYYDYEKFENLYNVFNEIFKVTDFGQTTQMFFNFIMSFHPVKRCFKYNELKNNDECKVFYDAVIDLEKFLINNKYHCDCYFTWVTMLLNEIPQFEEKFSKESILNEDKKRVLNCIKCFRFAHRDINDDIAEYYVKKLDLKTVCSLTLYPITDFNQAQERYKCFIDSFIAVFDSILTDYSNYDYFRELIEVAYTCVNKLNESIPLSEYSDENKLYLPRRIELVKNLCELHMEFLSVDPHDEKIRNQLSVCSDILETVDCSPTIKGFIDFKKLLYFTVKGQIVDNKLENESDFKIFYDALIKLATYENFAYSSVPMDGYRPNPSIVTDEILKFLNVSSIEEKISRSSISSEEKKYLINIVKCIKFFNDNKIEIKGAKLAQVAFEPIVNFNQTQIKCIEAIDEIIYLVYYLKNQGWRSEYSEMFGMYLNEFNERISLCICNDEEKQHLFNYFNFMTSLINYLKEDSHENKYCDYKKIDPILEQLNEILKIEKFSDYIKDFMEQENFFHLVKKCFQNNKLETDDDFNEVNSVLTEILKCQKQRNYCSAACLIENLSEEKISNSRLTDEQKGSLINRIKFINFVEFYEETSGVNTEIFNLFEILSDYSIPKDSEIMAKAYDDLMSYITHYDGCEGGRSYAEIKFVYNFLEKLGDSNVVTQITKSVCEASMKLCYINIDPAVKLFKIINEQIEKDNLLDNASYHDFYAKVKYRASSVIDRYESERKYLVEQMLREKQKEEEKQDDDSIDTEGLYFKRRLYEKLERSVQVKHFPSFIKDLSLIADGHITDFSGAIGSCQGFIHEFISFIFDSEYDLSKNNTFFNIIDELLKRTNKNIESCSCSEKEKNLLFMYVNFIQGLRELSKKSLFTTNPDDFEVVKRVFDDFINKQKDGDFRFSDDRYFYYFARDFIPIEEKIVHNKLTNEEEFNEFDAALAELVTFCMRNKIKYLHNSLEDLLQFKVKVSESSLTKEQKEHLNNRIESIFTIIKADKLCDLNTEVAFSEAIEICRKLRSKVNPDVNDFNKILYEFIGDRINDFRYMRGTLSSCTYNNRLRR